MKWSWLLLLMVLLAAGCSTTVLLPPLPVHGQQFSFAGVMGAGTRCTLTDGRNSVMFLEQNHTRVYLFLPSYNMTPGRAYRVQGRYVVGRGCVGVLS